MRSDIVRTTDVFLGDAPNPLIVILGPTAAGKTAFSIALAHYIDGEIINADSRQIYKYLDIGTAKISEKEMDGVPHHLIDVLDPKDEVTVGWFQREATAVIDDIIIRKKTPILVGGSMLYLASITDGLSLVPSVDPARHHQLIADYKKDDGKTLYKHLQKIDPDAAAAIHPNNMPRIVRAIEIYEVLKMPKSKVMKERGELRPRNSVSSMDTPEREDPSIQFFSPLALREKSLGMTGSSTRDDKALSTSNNRCQYNLLIFGVEKDSDDLKKKIAERTNAMIEAGWIEEVRELIAQGYTADDPGMKSHGYRQIMQYLSELESGDGDLETMKKALRDQINAKTRQYARRQMTWWRGDERIRWVSL